MTPRPRGVLVNWGDGEYGVRSGATLIGHVAKSGHANRHTWWYAVQAGVTLGESFPTRSHAVLAVQRRYHDTLSGCRCMTEDPGDGWGERVVTHSMTCKLHPEYDPA